MIRFTKAKHKLVRPIQKAGQKSVLQRLNEYLERYEPETVKILYRNIDNLQNVYTYKELRDAYFAGQIPPQDFQRWQIEYANVINTSFRTRWELAAEQAAEEIKALHPYFLYEPSVSSALEHIRRHGAELVTELAQEQIDALNAVIGHISGYAGMTADEASYIMRPLIGLNRPQAIANANYLRKVQTKYLKDHPNAKPATADKVARQAAARYGAKQHRYRAMMIARTELAFGYNAGHYGATKDAQKQGYIGECKKVWVTAYDERVCEICSQMDEEEHSMDEIFSIGKMLPPAHPNCRCAVAYEEIPGKQLTSAYQEGIINTMANTKITENGEVQNPMPKEEYERIKTALNKREIEVIAAVAGDDLEYMMYLGAEGTYSNGRITHIGEIPSRGTFYEEIIHMHQSKIYGELSSSDPLELVAREVEANRKLLQFKKEYRFDKLDIADIERNLARWEQLFTDIVGVNYDESNYRKKI